MAQAPLLSIVTGTRNREASFLRLVDSIVRNTDVPWELIVAQASDRRYHCERLLSGERVRFLEERPPVGPALGYNRCFSAASGEWVAWLNDDAEVEKDWARWALLYLTKRPEVGLGAMYFAVHGQGPTWRVQRWLDLPYANFGFLRRSLGDQLGWFDEDIRFYGCDNSLALKCLMAGKTIHGLPGARVMHHLFPDPQRRANLQHQGVDSERLYERYKLNLKSCHLTYARSPSPFPDELPAGFVTPNP